MNSGPNACKAGTSQTGHQPLGLSPRWFAFLISGTGHNGECGRMTLSAPAFESQLWLWRRPALMWVAWHSLLGPSPCVGLCCVCDVHWAVSTLRTGHHIDTAVPSQDWAELLLTSLPLSLAWWLQPTRDQQGLAGCRLHKHLRCEMGIPGTSPRKAFRDGNGAVDPGARY